MFYRHFFSTSVRHDSRCHKLTQVPKLTHRLTVKVNLYVSHSLFRMFAGSPGRPELSALPPSAAHAPAVPAGPPASAPTSTSCCCSPPPEGGRQLARCVAGARLYEAARWWRAGPMAAPGMAEPRSKRPRVTLPACPAHRPLPASRVRHGFPAAVEEALCGLTAAQLELHYCLQALVRRRGAGGHGGLRVCPTALRRRGGEGRRRVWSRAGTQGQRCLCPHRGVGGSPGSPTWSRAAPARPREQRGRSGMRGL